ncbi:Hpt domain-containing protein [Gemmobacter serpentinus]|uniref:Hpt domain-containing protein n=1 Tax=Gemmobacter serpentinus TaxID=2652247 RepID=UPI0018656D4F|nr:Hpt domain-containing protein [Gemmobacter serpentinus]
MADISPSLAPLRDRFIALNATRAKDLIELRNRIEQGRDPEASFLAMGEIVHKIAGVALTLGFPALGLRAMELDRVTIAFRKKEVGLALAWRQGAPILDAVLVELSA